MRATAMRTLPRSPSWSVRWAGQMGAAGTTAWLRAGGWATLPWGRLVMALGRARWVFARAARARDC